MAAATPLPTALERTSLLRSAPGEPAWELWRRTPPPQLAGLVIELWAGATAEAFARHRVLPNGELMLMLHVGPPQRVIEADGRTCSDLARAGLLAGIHERPFAAETPHRDTRVVTARLRPAGAAALLRGADPAELRGRVVDLHAIGRASEMERLRQQMSEAGSLGGALACFEAWLLARIEPRRLPRAATSAAAALIARSRGAARVEQISRELGVSPRRLNELFQRDVGVPAKRFARIVRFRELLGRLAASPSADLARLARSAGFYDQAHLNRDFRALALLTPTEYLAAHGDGLDGPDIVAG